jgi:hypothetical protein
MSFLRVEILTVLRRADATGSFTYSKALDTLVRGLHLANTWDQDVRPAYTHYTNKGASRIDRLYFSQALYCTRTGIETDAAVFTDHFAVVLRLAQGSPCLVRGRGLWKMKVSLLRDAEFGATVGGVWTGCCARINSFPM